MRSGSTGPTLLRCRHHLPELLLQVVDLVTEAGGEPELQLTRGGPHLAGELLDERGQLGAGQARDVGSQLTSPELAEGGHRLALAGLHAAGPALGLGAGPG